MGRDWSTWVVGKIPSGVMSDDVFVMKARLLAGYTDLIKDTAEVGWFSHQEMESQTGAGGSGSQYYVEMKYLASLQSSVGWIAGKRYCRSKSFPR